MKRTSWNFSNRKKKLKLLRNAAMILAGNAMLAFLVAAFVMPHDILMGGTTGIGIVIHRLTGFDTALAVLLQNLLLLLAGRMVLGRSFFLSTVVSSLLYPAFLGLFQRIPGIENMTDDPLLAAIYSGALMGLSLGLVMRAGSSTGGTDVLNLILAKWTHLSVAVMVWAVDLLVVGVQAPLHDHAEPVLYGVLVLLIESFFIDRVMIFGKAKVEVFAVSSKHKEIRQKLLINPHFGVTMSLIETGKLKEKQMAVICVTTPRKLHEVTEVILDMDPDAFLTITKIREVHGAGFTRDRVPVTVEPENEMSEIGE